MNQIERHAEIVSERDADHIVVATDGHGVGSAMLSDESLQTLYRAVLNLVERLAVRKPKPGRFVHELLPGFELVQRLEGASAPCSVLGFDECRSRPRSQALRPGHDGRSLSAPINWRRVHRRKTDIAERVGQGSRHGDTIRRERDAGQATRERFAGLSCDGMPEEQNAHHHTLLAARSAPVGRLQAIVNPSAFLRLVVDPVRLAVLGAAAVGPVDAARLAADLGVRRRVVSEALGRLRQAGLIDDGGQIDRAVLRALAESLPQSADVDPVILDGPWSAEEADVLSRFFVGDRLESIPANLTKRRIVLERLAQEFEPGLRYEEADVNFRLQLFHSDYAALRRYLVDESFLTRAQGVYWRSGGRFPDEERPDEPHDGE